jgi:hypothetical protein
MPQVVAMDGAAADYTARLVGGGPGPSWFKTERPTADTG